MEAGESNGPDAQDSQRDYVISRAKTIAEEFTQLKGPNAIIGELGELMAESNLIAKTRLNVLKEYSRNILVMPGVDLKKIADTMIGACGPELEEVCREARMLTLRGKRVHVTQEDLEMAMAKVMKDKQKNTFNEKLSKEKMAVAAIEVEEEALMEMWCKTRDQGDGFERKLSDRFQYLLHHLRLANHTYRCLTFEDIYRISRDHVLNEELKQLENGQYASDVQKVVGESEFLVNRRFNILRLQTRKMRLMPGIDLKEIAKRVNVASEAKLKDVCAEAGRVALLKGRVLITQKDFETAAAKVMEEMMKTCNSTCCSPKIIS